MIARLTSSILPLILALAAGLGLAGPAVAQDEPPRITESVLDGFDVLPADALQELRDDIGLLPGARLTDGALMRAREVAVTTLQERGYPYADVVIGREEETPGRVRIRLSAQPGPLAYFGAIEIVGNAHIDDGVIRRRLTYRPGEIFRRSALVRSREQVAALELFDSVAITVINADAGRAEVETRVTVVEGKLQRILFSGGYGTEEKLFGEATWRHVNFLGGGRTLGLNGKWSSWDRGIEGDFSQPYFFRPTIAFGLQGREWHVRTPIFRSLSRGGRATVGYRPSARFSLRMRLIGELERSRIANRALEDPTMGDRLISLGLDPRTGVQKGALIAVAAVAERRTVTEERRRTEAAPSRGRQECCPAPLINEPRNGHVLSLHLEHAGGWLQGAYDYNEVLGEARVYRTVAGQLTLAARIRYGSIAPRGLEREVPFSRRYFLGGAESLRGWGRLEVAPLSGSGLPIGGHSLFESSSEMRFPIVNRLGGVLFVDLGNVWTHEWDLRLGDLRYDAGLGLRYNSPFGPVRIDYAYQVNRVEGLRIDGKPQRRPWRVHFNFGYGF